MQHFRVCKLWVRLEMFRKERYTFMMKVIKDFWNEEDGIGVVEIILILVVLIMLIVIFGEQITKIVKSAFAQINSGAGKINTSISIGDKK